MFKAVIFDMDGVLIDSEIHWYEAEMNFLKAYDIKLTKEHAARMTGRSLHESVTILKEEFALPHSVEELLGEKTRHSEEIYMYKAQEMPGVTELLQKITSAGLQAAIASGSSLPRIKMIVDRFGWQDYFGHLVSTDHVNLIGKPDPAIYVYTAGVLQIDPAECLVIEDSVNGVRAAKRAGMSCAAVLDERWCWGDYSEADLVVETLTNPKLAEFIGIN